MKWIFTLAFILNAIDVFIQPVSADGLFIPGKLLGIGYREPDLQVPKTTFFISEAP